MNQQHSLGGPLGRQFKKKPRKNWIALALTLFGLGTFAFYILIFSPLPDNWRQEHNPGGIPRTEIEISDASGKSLGKIGRAHV